MPTYERYKYCGVPGCKNVAQHECVCGEHHPDEVKHWSQYAAKPEKVADHYKFLCRTCHEKQEEE